MDMHSTISSIITDWYFAYSNKHAGYSIEFPKQKHALERKSITTNFKKYLNNECYANHALTSSSNETEKETSSKIISTPFLGAVKSTFPSLCLMLELVGRSFRITVCPSSYLYIVHYKYA